MPQQRSNRSQTGCQTPGRLFRCRRVMHVALVLHRHDACRGSRSQGRNVLLRSTQQYQSSTSTISSQRQSNWRLITRASLVREHAVNAAFMLHCKAACRSSSQPTAKPQPNRSQTGRQSPGLLLKRQHVVHAALVLRCGGARLQAQGAIQHQASHVGHVLGTQVLEALAHWGARA